MMKNNCLFLLIFLLFFIYGCYNDNLLTGATAVRVVTPDQEVTPPQAKNCFNCTNNESEDSALIVTYIN